MAIERPASIPPGLRVELARQRVLPGQSRVADEWMQMLNDRLDECVATLDAEHMAIELAFRETDSDGVEWIYWVTVQGDGGAPLDERNAIDRDHVAMAKRCKPPGWIEATPQLLLLPDPVRRAVLAAARVDDDR